MRLKLKRSLVFFDLETTGVDVAKDRIVEMSFIKLHPNGEKEIKTRRVNPGIPIPKSASDVHGIYDADVKDCPEFGNLAKSLGEWLRGCDFAGFNSNRFDVPLLVEELLRVGVQIDVTDFKMVDVQTIYHKLEPRTLEAAYRFYCGKSIENAHSAEADIEATYEVLLAQIEKYEELGDDVESLSEFSKMNNNVDFAGRIIYDENGVAVFNFGKHKGRTVEDVFKNESSYYNWIMNGDFSQNTKNVCTQLRLAMYNTK